MALETYNIKKENEFNPVVSVIIPAYNAAPYISEAIASVQSQTLTDWELIVIDDGSSDHTASIACAAAAKDARVHVIRLEKNQGISAACNSGIAASRGEFIARLDADDMSKPERLASQVAAFRENDKLVAAGGHALLFGDAQGIAHCRLEDANIKSHLLSAVNNLCGNTLMVRRDFIEKHKIIYDENLKSAEDIDYVIAIMAAGGMLLNIDEIIIDHRVHASSITRSQGDMCGQFLTNVRQRLLKLWYPSLIQDDLNYITETFGNFFAPNSENLFRTIKSVDKLITTQPVNFGQNVDEVNGIVLDKLLIMAKVYRDSNFLNDAHLEAIKCFTSPATSDVLSSLQS